MSLESTEWKHGALTYSILEAFDGARKNGALSLKDLLQFTADRTVELTRKFRSTLRPLILGPTGGRPELIPVMFARDRDGRPAQDLPAAKSEPLPPALRQPGDAPKTMSVEPLAIGELARTLRRNIRSAHAVLGKAEAGRVFNLRSLSAGSSLSGSAPILPYSV